MNVERDNATDSYRIVVDADELELLVPFVNSMLSKNRLEHRLERWSYSTSEGITDTPAPDLITAQRYVRHNWPVWRIKSVHDKHVHFTDGGYPEVCPACPHCTHCMCPVHAEAKE